VLGQNVLPQRPDRHEEEPDAESPQPEPHHVGQQFEDDNGVVGAHEVGRENVLCLVAQRNETCGGKAGRSDGDKDAWALVVAGELLCHEAVEERGADHERYEKACALNSDGGESDRDRVEVVELARFGGGREEVTAKRGGNKKGICREDPDRGHSMNWKNSGWVLDVDR